jgi:hypothetical protein
MHICKDALMRAGYGVNHRRAERRILEQAPRTEHRARKDELRRSGCGLLFRRAGPNVCDGLADELGFEKFV